MRLAILANPRSGRGRGGALAKELAARLRARGHEVLEYAGADRRDAMDWVRRVQPTVDRLAVVGGDGSLNAAATALRPPFPPVLLLPVGTANLLARELGLPGVPEEAAALLEADRVQPLDLGHILGRRTFLVWDFGLGGELIRRFEEKRPARIRKAQYLPLLGSLLKELRSLPPVHVHADGEDLGEFVYGVVSGVRTYATSWLHLGPAAYNDGWWEMYLFRRLSLPLILGTGLRAAFRRLHRSPHVLHRRTRAVRVEGAAPSPVEVDGDYAGTTPVEFRLDGEALPLLVPPR